MIKLGIIGLGNQSAENIIPSCQLLSNGVIAAICDVDEARLKAVAKSIPNAKSFKDFRALIDSGTVDAVVAVCYPQTHFEIAKYAIAKGVHVFLEKPPASTLAEMSELSNLALKSGLVTGVGMNFRFADPVRRVERIIQSMLSNDIRIMNLKHYCNKPTAPLWHLDSLLRSYLLSQTIHSIDLLIHFCGNVSDISTSHDYNGKDLVMQISLRFDSGACAVLSTGNISPHFVFDFDIIVGNSTIIEVNSLWDIYVINRGKEYHLNEKKKWLDRWCPSPLSSGYDRAGYITQLNEFVTSIIEQRKFLVSFDKQVHIFECLEEIEKQVMAQHHPLKDTLSNQVAQTA